jgi:hypothetical protein
MDKQYSSFAEFYPHYLQEHSNLTCRRLHFAGTWLVVLIAILAIVAANAWWLLLMPVVGYGFAWVGHYFFEHNRPATFRYPLYSLMGDWVMWKDIMTGKVRI